MKKERKPDLDFPDEAAIEERVRQMMDITAPEPTPADTKKAPETPVTPPKAAKFNIAVSQDDEEPEQTISVIDTAPSLEKSEPVEPEVEEIPKVASVKETAPAVKKSILIKHFSDRENNEAEESEEAPESVEPAVEEVKPAKAKKPATKITIIPDEPEVLPETENPLIPTDKLVKSIAISTKPELEEVTSEPKSKTKKTVEPKAKAKSKPKAKKSIAITEPVAVDEPTPEEEQLDDSKPEPPETTKEPLPIAVDEPFDEVDQAVAAAFDEVSDELDEIAKEQPVKVAPVISDPATKPKPDVVKTAPPLPADVKPVDKQPKAPVTPQSEAAPKFDKFKPLTDIRPKAPEELAKERVLKLDDDAITKAVDEIVVTEADNLLSVPTKLPARRPSTRMRILPRPVPKARTGVRTAPAARRGNYLRRTLFAGAILALFAVLAVPTTRIPFLNAVGVRTTARLKVLDQSTGQPLKGVIVSIGGKEARTLSDGSVSIGKLKLGQTNLQVNRQAFANVSVPVKLGLGNNSLPEVSLVPTGKQISLTTVDYLSGKPLKAEVDSKHGAALADGGGLAKLTIEKSVQEEFEVTFTLNGYRQEKVTINPEKLDNTTYKLVLNRKYGYMANREGTYDLYASDIDGKNEKLILKGAGNENPRTTSLVSSSTDDEAALVSVRTDDKAADGSEISTLSLVNLRESTVDTVATASQLQLIGWIGQHLIYTQISSDSKSTDASRQTLISYDYKSKKSRSLASANYFNNVLLAGGKVYYAPSSAYQASNNVGFFKINSDGSGKQALLPLETWNVYRSSFSNLSLSVQQDWYDFKLSDPLPTKLNAAPDSLENILFSESPDGSHALYMKENGAQTTLFVHDRNTSKESTLISESGLREPIRWLNNNTVIYRIITSFETADYAYSLDGGTPQKIQDVADIPGVVPWQIR